VKRWLQTPSQTEKTVSTESDLWSCRASENPQDDVAGAIVGKFVQESEEKDPFRRVAMSLSFFQETGVRDGPALQLWMENMLTSSL